MRIYFRLILPLLLITLNIVYQLWKLQSSASPRSSSFIFLAIFIGLLIWMLWTICSKFKRRMSAGQRGVPIHQDTVEIEVSPQIAYKKCLQALMEFGAKIESEDSSKLTIHASTSLGWDNLGEKIIIEVIEKGNASSQIRISSWTKMWALFGDFGVGRENVMQISTLLNS